MPYVRNQIPEPDRALFHRCRALNIEIAHAIKNQAPAQQIDALRQLLKQEIPPDVRRKAQTLVNRADHESARLTALQAELEQASIKAESAAEDINNPNLRRFIVLFCIDGLSFVEVCSVSNFDKRTAERYRSLLNRAQDTPSEGIEVGSSHQTGTKR